MLDLSSHLLCLGQDVRLGDEDVLDELVVLLLVSGEHEAAGLQQVWHAVQLEHCLSSLGGAECSPQTQQTKTGPGPLGLRSPRPPAATTASHFNQSEPQRQQPTNHN